MSDKILLIAYVALALGISFLCSVLEAVLLSITPTFIATFRQENERAAETLAEMKTDVDRPLAAILSLNTIAHTIGASGAGAQAQKVFGNEAVTAASVVLTLLILVFSEIIPKTIGARYWKRLAAPVSRFLPWLIFSMSPFVWLSMLITRLFGASGHAQPTLSREEFGVLATIGHHEGVFEEDESRILSNLLRFESVRARDIMTPRTVIQAYSLDRTARDVFRDERFGRFSRLPVYGKDLDDVQGYVLKQDILAEVAHDRHDTSLGALRKDMLVTRPDITLGTLLDRMLRHQEHVALLVDDFGGTVGVVSMEDVIETLLGLEIVDESDATTDMQALARQRWQQRAQRIGLILDEAHAQDLARPAPASDAPPEPAGEEDAPGDEDSTSGDSW